MIIETEDLRKVYKNKTAVSGVSIQVEKGQIYGFLGPNGAGKSTFIKMLTGLVYPTSGKGEALGRPLGSVKARERMGYLPELFRYQEWMTGDDLLNFHTRLYKLAGSKERNRHVLSRVGLLGQEKYKVGSYSKGMQQRIGLACALLPEPELLFLDEPTSALDPIGRKEVRDIIMSLKNDGTTVFLNSHLLSEVEAVSDRVTIIHKGEVVKSGEMGELLSEKTKLTLKAEGLSKEILLEIEKRFEARIIEPTPEQQPMPPSARTLSIKNSEMIPEIAAFLVSEGVRIYEMTPRHETLENIFLKVVSEA